MSTDMSAWLPGGRQGGQPRRKDMEPSASAWSRRGSEHLAEDELVGIAADAGGGRPAAGAHLAACSRCAARLQTLRAGLDRITATAEDAFDDAMPAWRLVRQRRRILHRIQRAAGRREPARILRFPTVGAAVPAGAHSLRRRLSLAAAAGLLIAASIGPTIDRGHEPAARPAPAAAGPPPQPVSRPYTAPMQTIADEQLMREMEEALTSSRVTPLLALDEMTPRVRVAAIDIR